MTIDTILHWFHFDIVGIIELVVFAVIGIICFVKLRRTSALTKYQTQNNDNETQSINEVSNANKSHCQSLISRFISICYSRCNHSNYKTKDYNIKNKFYPIGVDSLP